MWYYKVNFQFVNPFMSVDTHERDVVGGLSVLLNNFTFSLLYYPG